MWRFFSALGILSVVAFFGLQGGHARSLQEQPRWQRNLDGADHGKLDHVVLGALGAFAKSMADPADVLGGETAGPASASPPHWAPPAEIAAKVPAIEHRSAAAVGALVWQPPAEIASARSLANGVDIKVGLAGPASPSAPLWAPPAEIARKGLATAQKPMVAASALIWQPPAEITGSEPYALARH